MTTHRVQQGECLSSIAAQHGMTWRQLWECPANESLREKRKNPNVLHPGDEVSIPEKKRPSVPLELDGTRTVTRRRAGRRQLELRVVDAAGKALADKEYKLAPKGGGERKGRTDARGIVREELPTSVQEATLEVGPLRFELDIGHLNPLEHTDDDGLSGAQARLKNLGYRVGKIDGLWGPRTEGAIRAFQRDERLEVTGKLDAATRTRLAARHGC
ncbi:MAG: peptidoglycan-binding protein [Planctomycetota bacterium]